jgi:hypothetical protein
MIFNQGKREANLAYFFEEMAKYVANIQHYGS